MRFRRRRFLIDGRLQFKLIAASIGYVAFYVVMMAVAIFAPLMFKLNHADPNSNQAYQLADQFIYLHGHIWPVSLMVLVLVSLHSLWVSHKVAGPLYRFRQIFLSLAAGKLPSQQHLRKRDYLQNEMKMINEALESLRIQASNMQKSHDAIAVAISKVAQRSWALSDQELTLLVADLESQGLRLKKQNLLLCKEP
jgi:methyl-accepting chemotaxis protein